MTDVSFYSMDKLVEFGLGTAVAAQMMNSMNTNLQQMKMPGVDNPMGASGDPVYFASLDGQASGPYSATELTRLIAEKKVVKETYIWKPGMFKWDLAQNLPEVLRLVALTPPPVPEG